MLGGQQYYHPVMCGMSTREWWIVLMCTLYSICTFSTLSTYHLVVNGISSTLVNHADVYVFLSVYFQCLVVSNYHPVVGSISIKTGESC